ncbi:recombinase family protein [Candidatus Binatus sp.]|uniref:recombinase family protein n=1 Tax=Candidatus Binatus sp. TaxID=2811406 RepID=UPI003CC59FCB
MSKITPDHLARTAYIYIRQSTPDQLINNPESRRRQYALRARAEALGWQRVIIIDDDLGRSGSGVARKGFERLLVAIGAGNVGAVLAIEASRLARNGRDWHTLLEFCALVGCLLIDEGDVYDPRLMNDRLLLGMKGTFSELELSLFRQRAHEALWLKAKRGELYRNVAIGYMRSPDDRLEMEPDRRVRDVLALVFRKFDEIGSVRQVVIWLREEKIEVPTVAYGAQGRIVEWHLPRYDTVHRLLTNPIYAGAYAFGRTVSCTKIENGRKVIRRGIRRRRSEWGVLLRGHHPGYISWEQYERNQGLIRENANVKGAMVAGSVRNGGGILAGMLRCGHCGRKLRIHHNGLRGVARYVCEEASVDFGVRARCLSFGNMRVDAAVSAEVLRVISPLAIAASVEAVAECKHAGTERIDQLTLALEQARYEAERARRQYDSVEPENRIVASELERRWNERLTTVASTEQELQSARDERPATSISEAEAVELLALPEDLPKVWNHPNVSVEIRKRVLRAVLEEIVVTAEPARLNLKLHWRGGEHTSLDVLKNKVGQHRWKTSTATEQLIRDLARLLPDGSIASVLNRLGVRSAKGHTWTELRIKNFRGEHGISVYRDGERAERGELILNETASHLGVSKMTVVRLIKDGALPARQACPGAPYVIRQEDLNRPLVQAAVANRRAVSHDSRQESLSYQ